MIRSIKIWIVCFIVAAAMFVSYWFFVIILWPVMREAIWAFWVWLLDCYNDWARQGHV